MSINEMESLFSKAKSTIPEDVLNALSLELRSLQRDPLWCAGQNLFMPNGGQLVNVLSDDRPGLDQNVRNLVKMVWPTYTMDFEQKDNNVKKESKL